MNDSSRDDRRDADLREAWNALSNGAETSTECPDPEQIWKAVGGELDSTETGAMVDHLIECPACSEAWRLAREMIRAERASGSTLERSDRRTKAPWRYPLAAAAALVLLLVGLRFLPTRTEDGPSYRQITAGELRSQLADEALSRNAFVLRWNHLGDGTLYEVRVMTEALGRVDAADGLEEPLYRVPTDRLAKIPDGTRLIWQVEAVLADGRRLDSETYFVEIESSDR